MQEGLYAAGPGLHCSSTGRTEEMELSTWTDCAGCLSMQVPEQRGWPAGSPGVLTAQERHGRVLLQLPLLAVLGTVHHQHQLVRCCDVADIGQDASRCS